MNKEPLVYIRQFSSPLLAIAFKEGIEFCDDPDYLVSKPKKEGDWWVVEIRDLAEYDYDDYDDESNHSKTSNFKNPKQWNSAFDNSASVRRGRCNHCEGCIMNTACLKEVERIERITQISA